MGQRHRGRRSLFDICDSDSQGLHEVHTILTKGKQEFRPDLKLKEVTSHVMFVYGAVFHPSIHPYRQGILDAALNLKLAEKLGRKRPSPLLHGSPNAWASGIVRAVGGVNFLHDKSQTPYMRSTDIDHYLGTSPSSGAAKLAAIRKMLKIYQLDPNWTLPSRVEDNPIVWMIQVNGFMVDVRHAPREVQEIAFNKGLIPYIPADRQRGE
jgi:hypothetical protein